MKYRAYIGNLLAKSEHSLATIENLRKAGYYIVSDRYQTYIECDSLESADIVELLNLNI